MSKISAYTALSSAASNDVLPIVDVSDTTMASSGTTKKITVGSLRASSATVPTFPQTYTGVTTAQTILAGPTYSPAANDVWEFDLWGGMTTTVDTQTVTFQVLMAGTQMVGIGGLNPNSGGTISDAAWRFSGKILFPDTTHGTCVGYLDLNYYFANVSQQGASSFTPPGQLAISYTPSASGLSLTVNGGYWRQMA